MPAPKNYIKIQYPRKCECCDHVSNSSPAYHYHNKKHQSIPTDRGQVRVCEYGCGQHATVITSRGKYICSKIFQQCPAYSKKMSDVVTTHWKDNADRKTKIKKLNQKKTEEKLKNFIPKLSGDYVRYAKRARHHARKWAREQGHELGRTTYHVDHKFSIRDGWNNNLPVDILSHPSNLQILEAKKNSSKGSKSSITLEELLHNTNLFYALT